MHLNDPPPPLDPALPAAIEQVIQHALAKHQDDRYPDATQMANALEQAAASLA